MNPPSFASQADVPAAPLDARPTRVRWNILALLMLISSLTYLDRLNMGIASKYIMDEFQISGQQIGIVLSAFVLGYAIFQIPGGWAGDRLGPKGVLTFAILWWSIFTAATGLAPRLPLRGWFGLIASFCIVRFLVGVGEASALPNSNKFVSYWMGLRTRGIGNSVFLTGIGVGGAATPIFIAWIMRTWSWPVSFYVCAVLGILVATVWHLYATNHPEEHRGVNQAELKIIHALGATPPSQAARPAVPWRKIFRSRSAWGLMLGYFCEGYPNYIFYTWFFLYLVNVRGFTVKQGSFWGTTPFIAVLLLAPLGGWFSDRAVQRLGKRRGRRAAAWVGMGLSGVLLVAGAHTANNAVAILLLAAAMGFNLFATSTWWATCIDVTPNFSGSLSALMNTWGNLAGAVSPALTPFIAERFGWTHALDFAALLTLGSIPLWFLVNAEDNLEQD